MWENLTHTCKVKTVTNWLLNLSDNYLHAFVFTSHAEFENLSINPASPRRRMFVINTPTFLAQHGVFGIWPALWIWIQGSKSLLAPTGALIVMMVYYISAAPTFSDFHSVPWCNWCYKCHSISRLNSSNEIYVTRCWLNVECLNIPMFRCSIGLLVYWFIGLLVHWYICALVDWSIGPLVHGPICSLVHWSSGLVVHWFITSLVHQTTGPLDHWSLWSISRLVHWLNVKFQMSNVKSKKV